MSKIQYKHFAGGNYNEIISDNLFDVWKSVVSNTAIIKIVDGREYFVGMASKSFLSSISTEYHNKSGTHHADKQHIENQMQRYLDGGDWMFGK